MNEFSDRYSPRIWRSKVCSTAICLAALILSSSCSSLKNRQSLFDSAVKETPKEQTIPKVQYDQLLVKYEALLAKAKRLEKRAQNSVQIEGSTPSDIVESLSNAKATRKTELAETVDVFAPPPSPKGISRKGKVDPSIHIDSNFSPDNLENSIVALRKAYRLVSKNKFNDAMTILKELENSTHRQVMVRAKFLIGDILYKQGSYDLALQVYEEIITNYAFSGIVLDTLRRLTICSEKLKLPKKKEMALIALLLLAKSAPDAIAADSSLELVEPADINLLLDQVEDDSKVIEDSSLNLSEVEELDDLESIRNDSEGIQFSDSPADLFSSEKSEKKIAPKKTVVNAPSLQKTTKGPQIFDVGDEEQKLLDMSKLIVGKMASDEWSEIASSSKIDQYEVQDGDWLWKISKRLFGSGFYYSKVWALNPQITNPHEIEPGMVLTFNTGDSETLPDVRLGAFTEEITEKERFEKRKAGRLDYRDFSDSEPPKWVAERKKLIKQGVYFQYASEETYDDLEDIGKRALINEYEKYEPPMTKIKVREPGQEYDEAGFDKNSKISFDFSEGFFLNTFVLSNIIVDLGHVDSSAKDSMFLHKHDRVFVKLDNAAKVKPGDMFSIYRPDGKVSHQVSDREGFSYTVIGQLKVIKQLGELWECEIFDASDVIRRDDRITTYNSKILKVYKTFSKRMIEAGIVAGYERMKETFSYGDVVYLDRGRIDGAELGNVFEIYSARDNYLDKTISPDPAYKIGEVTVISLSDNFATALVTSSKDALPLGGIAIAKTIESAIRAQRIKNGADLSNIKSMETKALDELDIELNLDDINEDLLDKADKIQLTDDELHELERQEREKSIIKEHEKDLKELERLENEISDAEAQLNEARVDEDKFLELQNLDDLEMKTKAPDPNAFGSLDEIEKESGRQYMDQDLNSKENPYGLTEFDLEEIDELLNTEAKDAKSK